MGDTSIGVLSDSRTSSMDSASITRNQSWAYCLVIGGRSSLELMRTRSLPGQLLASPPQFCDNKVLHRDQRWLPHDKALDGTSLPEIGILKICHLANHLTPTVASADEVTLFLRVWVQRYLRRVGLEFLPCLPCLLRLPRLLRCAARSLARSAVLRNSRLDR